jgi:hypothetical protein
MTRKPTVEDVHRTWYNVRVKAWNFETDGPLKLPIYLETAQECFDRLSANEPIEQSFSYMIVCQERGTYRGESLTRLVATVPGVLDDPIYLDEG